MSDIIRNMSDIFFALWKPVCETPERRRQNTDNPPAGAGQCPYERKTRRESH